MNTHLKISRLQRELAALQLEVVARLKHDAARLDAADRKALELAEAQAYASAGRTRESVNAFARLVTAHPDDAVIAQGYAQNLLEAGDRESLEQALGAWRNSVQ